MGINGYHAKKRCLRHVHNANRRIGIKRGEMKNKICDICGAEDNLQVHHISYEPEVTQNLCVSCHQKQRPYHGVGKSNNSPLFDKLKEKFIQLSEGGRKTRNTVTKTLGISYMTAYLWDKKLGIERTIIPIAPMERKNPVQITITQEQYQWMQQQPRGAFNLSKKVRNMLEELRNNENRGEKN